MDRYVLRVVSVLCIAFANLKAGHTVESGLAAFWANDQKEFHQIYGKTSDHDLYGDTLPLSVTHGIEAKKITRNDATRANSRDKQQGLQAFEAAADNSAAATQDDVVELRDNYARLLAKRRRVKTTIKPKPIYGPVFADESIIRNLKSANEATDQETIDYLKQFEHLGAQQAIDFPQEGLSGFKPYAGFAYRNVRSKNPLPAFDSYKSIQEIIDSQDSYEDLVFERQKANHELAHKAYAKVPKTHFASVDKSPSNLKAQANVPSSRFVQGNELSQGLSRGKCNSSRCRKPPSALRLRKVRPRLRKIQKIITLQN